MRTLETGHLTLLALAFTFASCGSSGSHLEGSIGFGLAFDYVEIEMSGDQLSIRYQKDVSYPSVGYAGTNTTLELIVPADLEAGQWIDIAYEAELNRYVVQKGASNPERDLRQYPELDEGFLLLDKSFGPGQAVSGQFWIHFEDSTSLQGSFHGVVLSEGLGPTEELGGHPGR